jgi:predicted ArsR family transcriptional regulator
VADWMKSERIVETTRGRVLVLLREGGKTADELALALGLTDNAVRAHLATLERDRLVQPLPQRRVGRVGKPATVYVVSPGADMLFSRAYVPLLTALLSVLGDQLSAGELRDLLADVGRRMAAGETLPAGELKDRVRAASQVLNQLGGVSSVEEVEAGRQYLIQSRGCPVGLAVSERPEVCQAFAALISQLIQTEVRSCCQQTGRASCCFEIAAPFSR